MGNRRRRNDPCWCGSGEKYKRCHLSRENQQPAPQWEIEEKLREAFARKTCLVPAAFKPECVKQISKAHTIPKSGSLERISRKGHVYSFVLSFKNLNASRGLIAPSLL